MKDYFGNKIIGNGKITDISFCYNLDAINKLEEKNSKKLVELQKLINDSLEKEEKTK